MPTPVTRRHFLGHAGMLGLGGMTKAALAGAPAVLTSRRARPQTAAGRVVFRPVLVQKGRGPHIAPLVYATDPLGDTIRSDAALVSEGVMLTDVEGALRFGVNARWNVEGFGYLFLTADNAGAGYALPGAGAERQFNLNYELAASRAARHAHRMAQLSRDGWAPSREVRAYTALADEYLADAARVQNDAERCGVLAQRALFHLLWAGDALELERAGVEIDRAVRRRMLFGCDARAYFQIDADLFMERFVEVFDFATVNHYLTGTHQDFEPSAGQKRFGLRDVLVDELRAAGIAVEGRPLVWFHKWVTPDWLRTRSYGALLTYVEEHVRDVIRHYGDRMLVWEIANEMHDWANELRLSPDQLVDVTKRACEVAQDTNPRVRRLINNCCVFGEYIHQRKWTELDATYPQRSPYQFMRELLAAGAPVDITGVQMYFPTRTLADSIAIIDRFADLGRPVHVTETGATSGPSANSVKLDTLPLPTEPYAWHRHWDEDLQAEWAEGLYTLAYSRPYVEAISWYDFADPYSYIRNGGLLRSPAGERKPVFDRLKELQTRWTAGPTRKVG